MDEGRLKAFVTPCLEYRDVFTGLVREHGSPLYVLDEGRLRSRARRFRQVFEECLGSVDVFFAMKSNNMPEVSRIMVEEGLGLDVSSGVELVQACEVGATRIFFSGPGKTEEELTAAINQADRVTVLMDSFGELRRLDHLTRQYRRMVCAGVRLTTNPNGLWRKFGIPLTSLAQFLREAHGAPFVKLEGLQFHTSWNLLPDAQTAFIARLRSELLDLPANLLETMKFLDIGGGFWPEQGEWLRAAGTPFGKFINLLFPGRPDTVSRFWLESCPIDIFADQIAETLQAALPKTMNCRICLEPGRWLCHEAMHLLMTVVDVKADNLAITDAGTNAIGWERFEQDYFPVINLTHPEIEEHPCDILGSLCTPHDVWGYSYHGTAIRPGDLLLIPTQGAYTYSLRQDFIKPLPEVTRLPQLRSARPPQS
ncbi:MAG: decarboxylase [Alphaproteobacteria bacterium]|nr:decarboxylase [Alphaproteobacteria bacterium]